MNVAAVNTPAGADLTAKEELRSAVAPTKDEPAAATPNNHKEALSPEEEEDEEVRLAMEMALAAAQNPRLNPQELRKLVAGKNKQLDIVCEIEQHKQKAALEKQEKEKEEAKQRWEHQKESAWKWWTDKKGAVASKAEELKFEAEKQFYAEDIKQDKEIIAIRKKMKMCKKAIKAHRLQGNRVETRHTFKRRRMEKNLMELNKRLHKTQLQLTNSSFGVHEYAKAMMRATKKWRKQGSKQELALEAQLCRNMHQMLALEKQRAMTKKSAREIKKYLQRCKSWLSDKKAFCEMHMITLEATAYSMKYLYEDTLARQDALIRKLKDEEEFKGVDLSGVDLSHFDYSIEQAPGPSAMLNALRGLPIRDSIRISKEQIHLANIEEDPSHHENNGRPELYIEAKDDVSVSSNLSDPDGDFEEPEPEPEAVEGDSDSEGGFDFGNDAPWNSHSNLSNGADEDAKPAAHKAAPEGAMVLDEAPTEKLNNEPVPEHASVAESTLDGAAIDMPASAITRSGEKTNFEYSVGTINYVSDASDEEGDKEAEE